MLVFQGALFLLFFPFSTKMTWGEGQARHDGFKKIFVQVLRRLSTPAATRSKSSIALTKPGEGSLFIWNCSCRCCLTYRTSTISRIWLFSAFPLVFGRSPSSSVAKTTDDSIQIPRWFWDKPPGLWDSVVKKKERFPFFFSWRRSGSREGFQGNLFSRFFFLKTRSAFDS